MAEIRDADGQLLVRSRDGDLVPVVEAPVIPTYEPGWPCAEHYEFAYNASTCPACWSEIHGGDRPRTHLGRRWPTFEEPTT